MKTKTTAFLIAFIISFSSSGQIPDIQFTFTAIDSASNLPFDSLKVMNQTQGGDTVLYWPDTVLSFYTVGIKEIDRTEHPFRVFQNYPNPVTEQTNLSIYIPEKDRVRIVLTDLTGRIVLQIYRTLDKGTHLFHLIPGGKNLYFLAAQWKGKQSSIKIVNFSENKTNEPALNYSGLVSSYPYKESMAEIQNFSFSPGDSLLCICYSDTLESGILDAPDESKVYTFQFATNIPCPGTPTVEYEGQVYNTIQVFSQCWLKENLNVGEMIAGADTMQNNGIIEKKCYENQPDSCTKYGGLYEWSEMMQYTLEQGTQGICPPGWHIPTDEEWKVLEGAVDSQYAIGDPEWDSIMQRGFDASMHLKTTSGWLVNQFNGFDTYGFSALPGGRCLSFGNFNSNLSIASWWASSIYTDLFAYNRSIILNEPMIRNPIGSGSWFNSLSVRCIKDE